MKILPLLLGSLVASITFGGAFAQMYGPQGGYNSPPAYGHRLIHREGPGNPRGSYGVIC
jgi:hypothetical protein